MNCLVYSSIRFENIYSSISIAKIKTCNSFIILKKFSYVAPFTDNPSPPLMPWQLLIYYLSVVLPFREGPINGIMQYIDLWVWLLLFTLIYLKFIHVVCLSVLYSLLLNSTPLYRCISCLSTTQLHS